MVVGEDLAEHDASLAAGAALGRYVVIEVVGRGGVGEVIRAYDPKLRREGALKRVRSDRLGTAASSRLLREAQAMARLRHPNVVAVYDVEVDEGALLLAMEYVDGVTLQEWLRQEPRSWQEVLRVFRAAGTGLAAAHPRRDRASRRQAGQRARGRGRSHAGDRLRDRQGRRCRGGGAQQRGAAALRSQRLARLALEPAHRGRSRGRDAAIHGARARRRPSIALRSSSASRRSVRIIRTRQARGATSPTSWEATTGPDSLDLAEQLLRFGSFLRDRGRDGEARDALARAHAIAVRNAGDDALRDEIATVLASARGTPGTVR